MVWVGVVLLFSASDLEQLLGIYATAALCELLSRKDVCPKAPLPNVGARTATLQDRGLPGLSIFVKQWTKTCTKSPASHYFVYFAGPGICQNQDKSPDVVLSIFPNQVVWAALSCEIFFRANVKVTS